MKRLCSFFQIFIFIIFLMLVSVISGYQFESNLTIEKSDSIKLNRFCATDEIERQQLQKDPSYKSKRENIEKFISDYELVQTQTVVTIPVVVHVVYHTQTQNISDAQIFSEIDVLNKDFRRLNSDTIQTPQVFKQLGSDFRLEFQLARQDPNGNATNGITRTFTNETLFIYDDPNQRIKFTNLGGFDIWDRDKYLNIWVCNLRRDAFGYSRFPGEPAPTDGVVISYDCFGTVGILDPSHSKGRVSTHEIGHWFDLRHIWGGGDSTCSDDDLVSDTPLQFYRTPGTCPVFPYYDQCTSSFPGIMFMNYMDYTNESCMNIFTHGQYQRVQATINGSRASLKTSNGLQCVSTSTITSKFSGGNWNDSNTWVGDHYVIEQRVI